MHHLLLLLSLAGCTGKPPGAPPPVAVAPAELAVEHADGPEAAPSWLPTSVSTVAATESPAAVLRVTDDELLLNGVVVAPLVDGELPESALRGLLISSLYDRLLPITMQVREQQARLGASSAPALLCRLEAEADTPFATLLRLLYTAGQAQITSFELAARSTAPGAPLTMVPVELPTLGAPVDDDPAPPSVSIRIDANGFEVSSHTSQRAPLSGRLAQLIDADSGEADSAAPPELVRVDCASTPCADASAYDAEALGRAVEAMRTEEHGPLVVFAPEAATPYQAMIRAMDAVNGPGGRALKLVVAGGIN